MAERRDQEKLLDAAPKHLWGAGVGIIALAWCAAPLVRFVPPVDLFWVGTACLVGISVVYEAATSEESAGRRRIYAAIGSAALVVAVLLVLGNFWRARADALANSRRCLAIQRDMLSSHPRMANGAEVFGALQCSPIGGDPRIYVPPTSRERKAGHPLTDGGFRAPS